MFMLVLSVAALLGYYLAVKISVPICLFLLLMLIHYIGGRWIAKHMIRHGSSIFINTVLEFKPNLIVANSLACALIFSVEEGVIPKVPMLLLAPGQDAHARYIGTPKRNYASLKGYPYTLLVHGSGDTVVPLDDSMRIAETADAGRCRMELTTDTHALAKLEVSSQEIRNLLKEVYRAGRRAVQEIYDEENRKDVDPTLFDNELGTGSESDHLSRKSSISSLYSKGAGGSLAASSVPLLTPGHKQPIRQSKSTGTRSVRGGGGGALKGLMSFASSVVMPPATGTPKQEGSRTPSK